MTSAPEIAVCYSAPGRDSYGFSSFNHIKFGYMKIVACFILSSKLEYGQAKESIINYYVNYHYVVDAYIYWCGIVYRLFGLGSDTLHYAAKVSVLACERSSLYAG